jgi:hypothetical protein
MPSISDGPAWLNVSRFEAISRLWRTSTLASSRQRLAAARVGKVWRIFRLARLS